MQAKYESFMNQFRVANKESESTHTTFGGGFNGSYNIPNDKLKELSKLDKEEINELNNKINLLEKTNNVWSEKDSLSDRIIKSNEEKFNIIEIENKDLRKENKRLKTKNGLFNIISAAIIAPLTYLLIIK